MDIEYLLLLQNFRNAINDALTPLMEAISYFAVSYLTILPAYIYWCIDKKKGLYTLASLYLGVAVNGLMKLSACVYRPWIRDSRVIPAGDSIRSASGYSFPSGHTMMATTQYGGIAVGCWKKLRWVSVICIAFIALTGFSRNYLGVHTPQDVIVGLIVSALLLWLIAIIFRYIETNPSKENLFLIAGIVFGIASIIYISLKSYPVDYVDGQILVDPKRMVLDGYGNFVSLISFCIARFIEKTWVRYEPKFTKKSIAAGLLGAVILYFLMETVYVPANAILGDRFGSCGAYAVNIFFIVTIWPAVMKALQKTEERTAEGVSNGIPAS